MSLSLGGAEKTTRTEPESVPGGPQQRDTYERAEGAVGKGFRGGTDRQIAPAETLEKARRVFDRVGLTRVADVTGLDRLGVPVVAVYRPNSRSLTVSQGKGFTMDEARVSGVMEAIELWHAEHIEAPLRLAAFDELRTDYRLVDLRGLPRLSVSIFRESMPLLWMGGIDLLTGLPTMLPYEMVHTDFRVPLPTGSGAFLMSSNGLASGNHFLEALSHALCEVVERDATTLWRGMSPEEQSLRRVDPRTVDDSRCATLLDRFEEAGLMAAIWDCTSDIGIATFMCTVVDRDEAILQPMQPSSGAGCHPRRAIALLRALTEAAQSRLTVIAGARDDLKATCFERGEAIRRNAAMRRVVAGTIGIRSFHVVPDANHGSFDADVAWELRRLVAAGIQQVIAVDLERPGIDIPVVKVVVPYLEAMAEIPGYVLGTRARRAREAAR